MNIREKIFLDLKGLEKEGPINIVVFGDSVTHGALYGCFNYETVYWNLLRQKICAIRDYVPVNVINAGIASTTPRKKCTHFLPTRFLRQYSMVQMCAKQGFRKTRCIKMKGTERCLKTLR